MPLLNKPFYTTGEIAKLFGISLKTVQNYCSQGRLKSEQAALTGYRRIPRENLLEFIKHNPLPFRDLSAGEPAKILLVDDDAALLPALKDCLLAAFQGAINLETACDGYEACIKAGILKPDLVILDLLMPRTDGFEVIERIQAVEATRHAEIIVMSGYLDESNRQRLDRFKVAAVFSKPLDIPAFVNCVKKVLELEPAGKGL